MLTTVNIHKLNGSQIPDSLRYVNPVPSQLFYKGIALDNWLKTPKLAVVGSRKMNTYGAYVTQQLVTEAARSGITIISGLAYGIDGAAHQAALAAGGKTIAVLPTPLDNIYPASHLNLANQIVSQGALISEYDKGAIIYKTNFTARNRLIAGLADAVLIPEAALKSGSLHTARFALEQGKTVLAVPGNINSPGSEGCNNLIKSGAIPATMAADIFAAMDLKKKPKRLQLFVGDDDQQTVYELIRDGMSDQDELASQSGYSAAQLAGILTGLELNGYIRPLGAGHWTI